MACVLQDSSCLWQPTCSLCCYLYVDMGWHSGTFVTRLTFKIYCFFGYPVLLGWMLTVGLLPSLGDMRGVWCCPGACHRAATSKAMRTPQHISRSQRDECVQCPLSLSPASVREQMRRFWISLQPWLKSLQCCKRRNGTQKTCSTSSLSCLVNCNTLVIVPQFCPHQTRHTFIAVTSVNPRTVFLCGF